MAGPLDALKLVSKLSKVGRTVEKLSDVQGVKLHKAEGGAVRMKDGTDEAIRQILEQTKNPSTATYDRLPTGTMSQFEQEFRDRLAREQTARQNAVKRGVSSWIPEIPGMLADLAVDVPYNLAQRAAGKRGENIKPLGFGEDVRRSVSQALGMAPASLGEAGMSMPPDETNEAVTTGLQLANPLMFGAAGNPAAIARVAGKGAKAVGKGLGPTMDSMIMEIMEKQGLAPGVIPKGADMSGWMGKSGRSIEEAQRLFEIAQGTRAKVAQEAAGLYHPIGGGNKLSKPIEMMNFKTVKDPTVTGVDRKIITPEDMYGGVAIPFVGDRSAGGKLLTEVEGTRFNNPLTLEAGPDYQLTHTIPGSPESSIWRSGKGVITGLKNQVDFANSMNRPIFGVNIVGAPTNVNYNTMVTEAILNQYDPTKITKKAKKEFLKDVRNFVPDASNPHLKPGSVLTEADLNDVEALRAKMLAEGAGPLRKVFVERVGQAPFQAAGFPDVPASRLATTEPLLVNVPTGSAGFTIGKIDPAGRVLEQTPRGHKTYSTSLGGEYYGSLAEPMDFRDIFQGFADKRRTFGKPKESDLRSFSLAPQIQTLDQQWLDRAMKATGANKPREWKKGGKVVKKAAGGLTSDDLVLEERKL